MRLLKYPQAYPPAQYLPHRLYSYTQYRQGLDYLVARSPGVGKTTTAGTNSPAHLFTDFGKKGYSLSV